jgi:hypothetical protein
LDDILDGFVGAIGGFKATVGPVLRIGAMVETAVGERPAQPFMEEQEEQRDLDGGFLARIPLYEDCVDQSP